jgi:hypothetical protein
MKVEKEIFSVLIRVTLMFIDNDLFDFMNSEDYDKKTPVIDFSTEVFFVVPSSKKNIVFMNSETHFFYGNNTRPINSLLIPYEINYLSKENIQKVFDDIEFIDHKREDCHYIVDDIQIEYMLLSGIRFKTSDSQFEV